VYSGFSIEILDGQGKYLFIVRNYGLLNVQLLGDEVFGHSVIISS
jgi:hypothetical protein